MFKKLLQIAKKLLMHQKKQQIPKGSDVSKMSDEKIFDTEILSEKYLIEKFFKTCEINFFNKNKNSGIINL